MPIKLCNNRLISTCDAGCKYYNHTCNTFHSNKYAYIKATGGYRTQCEYIVKDTQSCLDRLVKFARFGIEKTNLNLSLPSYPEEEILKLQRLLKEFDSCVNPTITCLLVLKRKNGLIRKDAFCAFANHKLWRETISHITQKTHKTLMKILIHCCEMIWRDGKQTRFLVHADTSHWKMEMYSCDDNEDTEVECKLPPQWMRRFMTHAVSTLGKLLHCRYFYENGKDQATVFTIDCTPNKREGRIYITFARGENETQINYSGLGIGPWPTLWYDVCPIRAIPVYPQNEMEGEEGKIRITATHVLH